MDNKMLLGVRYCGGCRAGYDRVAFVRALLEQPALQALGVVPCYDRDIDLSVGVLVCGCNARCIQQSARKEGGSESGWHVIGPHRSFDHVECPVEKMALVLADELVRAAVCPAGGYAAA